MFDVVGVVLAQLNPGYSTDVDVSEEDYIARNSMYITSPSSYISGPWDEPLAYDSPVFSSASSAGVEEDLARGDFSYASPAISQGVWWGTCTGSRDSLISKYFSI